MFSFFSMQPEMLFLEMALTAMTRYQNQHLPHAKRHGQDLQEEMGALVFVNQADARWILDYVAEHSEHMPEEICAFMSDLHDLAYHADEVHPLPHAHGDPDLN